MVVHGREGVLWICRFASRSRGVMDDIVGGRMGVRARGLDWVDGLAFLRVWYGECCFYRLDILYRFVWMPASALTLMLVE